MFVTHDQEEALEVADTIVVMNQGKVEQVGSPQAVYDEPATPFIYEFLGNVNVFETNSGKGFVRPYEISVSRESVENGIQGSLTYVHSIGSLVRLEIKRADNQQFVDVELTRTKFKSLNFKQGENVFIKPVEIKMF